MLAQLRAKVEQCLKAASSQNMAILLILMPVRKCQKMLKWVGAKQITRSILYVQIWLTNNYSALLNNGYWVSFLVVKQMGDGNDYLPPSSTKIEDRLQP
jgi:hypothetical protein